MPEIRDSICRWLHLTWILVFNFSLLTYRVSSGNICDDSPCIQGLCVQKPNNSGYECLCQNGFKGYNCSEDIDECEDPPIECQVCSNSVGSFYCGCDVGYESSGTACKETLFYTNISPNPQSMTGDDQMINVEIPAGFPFFGDLYMNATISTNGYIFLGYDKNPDSLVYGPNPVEGKRFPEGKKVIAPFWTDLAGEVTINITTRADANRTKHLGNLYVRAESEVRKYRGIEGFKPFSITTVDWMAMTQYGDTQNGGSASFQAVLMTDGLHSYILYHYGKMNLTSDNDTKYHLIGYSDGKENVMDTIISATLQDSFHPEINSNVGAPGLFLYDVGHVEENTNLPCVSWFLHQNKTLDQAVWNIQSCPCHRLAAQMDSRMVEWKLFDRSRCYKYVNTPTNVSGMPLCCYDYNKEYPWVSGHLLKGIKHLWGSQILLIGIDNEAERQTCCSVNVKLCQLYYTVRQLPSNCHKYRPPPDLNTTVPEMTPFKWEISETGHGVGFPEAIRVNLSSSDIVLNITAVPVNLTGERSIISYEMSLFFLDAMWTTLESGSMWYTNDRHTTAYFNYSNVWDAGNFSAGKERNFRWDLPDDIQNLNSSLGLKFAAVSKNVSSALLWPRLEFCTCDKESSVCSFDYLNTWQYPFNPANFYRAECFCTAGYKRNGTQCTEIDDLHVCDPNPCYPGVNCQINRDYISEGGPPYETKCGPCPSGMESVEGYLQGFKCAVKDVCSTLKPGCSQICRNMMKNTNGYVCSCMSGYELLEDGKTCQDIDECRSDNYCYQERSYCENTPGSYKCHCKAMSYEEGNCCKPAPEKFYARLRFAGLRLETESYIFWIDQSVESYFQKVNRILIPEIIKAFSEDYGDIFVGATLKTIKKDDMDEQPPAVYNGVTATFLVYFTDSKSIEIGPQNHTHSSLENSLRSYFTNHGCQMITDDICNVDPFVGLDISSISVGTNVQSLCLFQDDNDCDALSTVCNDEYGKFLCQCKTGFERWRGSTDLCKDIDECSSPSVDCPKGTRCVNLPGSYKCDCMDGQWNGEICEQNDGYKIALIVVSCLLGGLLLILVIFAVFIMFRPNLQKWSELLHEKDDKTLFM